MPARPCTTTTAVRAGAGAALATALVLGSAAAASAHVHVDPATTDAGAYAVLTVRVPNESPTAATTQVAVDLPTDHPLTYVGLEPVPGWTGVVEEGDLPEPVEVDGATITRAPVRVVWTADGSGIGDGQFQRFTVSAGPLPEAGTEVVLPAHQTYSDGSVVDWDQVSEDGTEPELPAPVFTTTEAAAEAGSSTTASGGRTDAALPADDAAADDDSALPAALGGFGLAAGLIALVVAVLAWRRSTAATR
jgi:uncharacterized protein YcnI